MPTLWSSPFTHFCSSAFYIKSHHLSTKPPTNCHVLPKCLTMGNIEPDPGSAKRIHILHFNDCYNVESSNQEPVGGAARFATALRTFQELDPIVLFSGDIIAPSIMSTFTKGEQMLPVLERCNVDCALFGNHEFDFGLEHLVDFAKKTKFPWLMSNVFLKNSPQVTLGEGKITHILEKNGIKIGLIGLIEEEWLSTLVLDPDDIHYVDFITEGRKLARSLRENDNVDLVIALTHMRSHNDVRLAESTNDLIDLYLGGHDHDYSVLKVCGKYIVKSGTDFRQLSHICFTISKTGVDVQIEEINVTSKFEEDPLLASQLEQYKTVIEEKMENVIAYVECDFLDGKFSSIRSKETNLGNLIADIMLDAAGDGDFALLNSGTLRSDRIHPKGEFKMRDLVTILPYMESILVLEITGEQVHKALENSVSQYPKLEGRFPQVAGICFAFDPSREPGNRVPFESIKIAGRDLVPDKVYRMVTKEFIANGKDGFDVLKSCRVVRTTEDCMPMTQAVQEYFEATRRLQVQQIMQQHHSNGDGQRRRQSIIALSRRSQSESAGESAAPVCRLNPMVEGRIVVLGSQSK